MLHIARAGPPWAGLTFGRIGTMMLGCLQRGCRKRIGWRTAALVLLCGILPAACADVPDLAQREPVPGSSGPFPNLASVPPRPVPELDADKVAAEKRSLAAELPRAERDDKALRARTDDAEVLKR